MRADDPRPVFVRIGLYGIRTRRMAMSFARGSLYLSAAFLLLGELHPALYAGAPIFLAVTAWYRACATWIDRHGRWEDDAQP